MNTVHVHILQKFKYSAKSMNINLGQNSVKGTRIIELKNL